MAKISMKDIAKIANVSKATISRVLHHPDKVSEKTRLKVLKTIKEHNYIYDGLAGDFSRSQSSVIGLIVPTNQVSIIAEVANGIHDTAWKRHFSVISANSYYDQRHETDNILAFLQRRVAGIILCGLSNADVEYQNFLAAIDIPVIVLWDTPKHSSLSYVANDNAHSGRTAAEYLLKLGHRKIGYIVGERKKFLRMQERVRGFEDTLREAGVEVNQNWIVECDISLEGGKNGALKILSQKERPTAIVGNNDVLAFGAMVGIKEFGLRVPDDISVFGHDDIDFAAYCDPSLTTIRMPGYEIGKKGTDILFRALDSDINCIEKIKMKTNIIIRNSCRSI